jgi:PAS domain S-box-containing protein
VAAFAIFCVAVAFPLLALHDNPLVALLLYLPGIALFDYYCGPLCGGLAILLSFAGNAWYRHWLLRSGTRLAPVPSFYWWRTQGILILLGALVIYLIEFQRQRLEKDEEELARLRPLFQNMSEAAYVFDRKARLVAANAAGMRLWGRRPEDLIGQHLDQLASAFKLDESASPTGSAIRAALNGSIATVDRGLFDPQTKRRLHIQGCTVPIRDAEGEVAGALLLVSDVSETKALQARMLENERHWAMGQMAAGVSHDFNNILEVIEKAATILNMMQDRPAEERRTYIDMLQHAARRGAETVRRLREYLAGGTGEMRPVDMNELARDSIELTRPLWRHQPNLDVRSDLSPIPLVRGNPVDLRRVLTNLILNTIEAMGRNGGAVLIHTEYEPPLVRCWVEDNGPGIPEEAQSKIFSAYYTTKVQGTGLGLSGAQRIILAHGGNLTFYSEVGRGTRFNIELPAVAQSMDEDQIEVPRAFPARSAELPRKPAALRGDRESA